MSAFGLFSPFDMMRIFTLLAELASHVMVLYSLTFTSSTTIPVCILAVLTSLIPLVLACGRHHHPYFDDVSSPQQLQMEGEQAKMRMMARNDSYRPEVLLFGLGPWILRSWTQARTVLNDLEESQKDGYHSTASLLCAHFDLHNLISNFQNVRTRRNFPVYLLVLTLSFHRSHWLCFSKRHPVLWEQSLCARTLSRACSTPSDQLYIQCKEYSRVYSSWGRFTLRWIFVPVCTQREARKFHLDASLEA